MQVTLSNYGTFEIPNEKTAELVQWLEQNSVKLQENTQEFNGKQLLRD